MALEQGSILIDVTEPDSLAGRRMALSVEDLSDLGVSRGRKSRTVRGALLGAGAGLAAGAVLGGIVGSSWPDVPEPAWLVGAAYLGGIGLLAGAGIGALVGTLIRVERWQDVPPDTWRVSLSSDARTGSPVGVTVRFEVTFPVRREAGGVPPDARTRTGR